MKFSLSSMCVFLLTFFLSVTAGGSAQDQGLDEKIKRKEADLREIRAQIEQCRLELDQLRGKETGLLDSLRTIEKELSLLQKFIAKLDSRQRELKEEINRAQADLTATEERLETQRQRLAQRLRTMYKQGRFQFLEVLFTSSSPTDLFRRYKYMSATANADRRILSDITTEKTRLENIREELQAGLAENRRLRSEKKQEETRMLHLQNRRTHHVTLVKTQLSTSKQVMAELEEESKRMEAIIERLEKERRSLAARKKDEGIEEISADFSQYKGGLPWPVRGQLLSTFGLHRHPIFKTTTVNKGIDIQAPSGTDIVAVAPGRVIMIDWLRGYGKFLIIDHEGGYYSLYAHTSEVLVAEGATVEAGEIIAKVGDTGSLQGPMLHFEIREGKNEHDPLLWLRKE